MLYGSDLPVGLADPEVMLENFPSGEDPRLEFTKELFKRMRDEPHITGCKNPFDQHYLMTKLVLDMLGKNDTEQDAFFNRGAKLLGYD